MSHAQITREQRDYIIAHANDRPRTDVRQSRRSVHENRLPPCARARR